MRNKKYDETDILIAKVNDNKRLRGADKNQAYDELLGACPSPTPDLRADCDQTVLPSGFRSIIVRGNTGDTEIGDIDEDTYKNPSTRNWDPRDCANLGFPGTIRHVEILGRMQVLPLAELGNYVLMTTDAPIRVFYEKSED